ncbi:doubled cxxch domain-containing protein [Leptolyngbya sp. Heron Island J]|uniref:cytochrome c3 family protein n=1 Tax=Leptolyngbya sp. Heron Island J TaxID=1385935 RepID=UPI0003B940F6|nr:cytochrome c3 family protein [Leptolyngbya sp. Heron Island J]ESA34850.1 doubled cxxch domain-containing protein [Leptolyngbya sp. Heron Island J]
MIGRQLTGWLRSLLVIGLSVLLMFIVTPMASATTQQELDDITELWQTSAHALNDINCASCHQNNETKEFVAVPDHETCRSCHEQAVDTFLLSKHGIRLLEGDSPLTPAMARLPMQHEAMQKQMNCNACHNVHSANTTEASVDACLTCHNDNHSLNYQNSRHAELFAASQELPRPGPGAVSCSTCHLPRVVHGQGDNAVVKVNHNNTYNLKPQDRMVGDVCMSCHGIEYSYNSIFDPELVEANFDRPPNLEMETFELMKAAEARRTGNTSE